MFVFSISLFPRESFLSPSLTLRVSVCPLVKKGHSVNISLKAFSLWIFFYIFFNVCVSVCFCLWFSLSAFKCLYFPLFQLVSGCLFASTGIHFLFFQRCLIMHVINYRWKTRESPQGKQVNPPFPKGFKTSDNFLLLQGLLGALNGTNNCPKTNIFPLNPELWEFQPPKKKTAKIA